MSFACLCTVLLTINKAEHTLHLSDEEPRTRILCDAHHIAENATRLHGLLEISFRVHHEEGAAPAARGAYLVAVFPSGMRHYLGPLTSSEPVESSRLVRQPPSFLEIELHSDAWHDSSVELPWPCEMLLKEHVKTFLDADDFCGSVPCSHVQNMVKELPFYQAGMQRFLNWSDFVRHFHETYGAWNLVVYRTEQHERLELSELVVPGELRMVSNRFKRSFVRGDVLRDRVKWRALMQLSREANLMDCAAECDDLFVKIPSRLLERFSLSPNLRALHNTNITHYLDVLPSCFDLLMVPTHPISIEQRTHSVRQSETPRQGAAI